MKEKKSKYAKNEDSFSVISRIELYTYVVLWSFGVCYSLYRLYLSCLRVRPWLLMDYDFQDGWTILGLQKDTSDFEWSTWMPVIKEMIPYLIMHSFVTDMLKRTYPKSILVEVDTQEAYVLHVIQGWMICRGISASLDSCDHHQPSAPEHLLRFMGYCLYLPLNMSGPLVTFSQYITGISSPPQTRSSIVGHLGNFVRYVFWWLVTDLILHFICCSITYHKALVENLDNWSLAGLGYFMGQFFMLKYTVTYGMMGLFARSEGIAAPSQPKCIGRIHLYSDMWKYFDRGLHKFLVSYIYSPIIGEKKSNTRKFMGAFICFSFVYVWHGTASSILVWTVLNFVGVTIENVALYLGSMEPLRGIQREMPPAWLQRFHCVLASPLLVMSALSNFYFLTDVETGNIFILRVLHGWGSCTPVLLCFFYCCCHTSIAVRNWEKRRSKCDPKKVC